MADREVEIRAKVDTTQAEQGLDKLGRKLDEVGTAAQKAGSNAGAGLDKIGKNAQEGAQDIDRSTRSIIQSVQRTTAVLEAGGRTNRAYFEALANQRGANLDTLKPYLDQLDAVNAKQQAATSALLQANPALRAVGVSAGQTAEALRQLPAQFTDIFTSLASGQAPLMVLIQQGGQIKDSFGGIAPALKAVGSAVLGLINPFTIAAAAVGGLALAYFQGSKESDAYQRALILTGNAAGTTAGRLAEMAQRIGATNGTVGAAASALAELAGSTKIAGRNLEEFAAVAVRMERVTGQAVSETRKQFEELAKSPGDAALKLNESLNFLSASIYKQIRALEEQGRANEAAELAQRTLAATLDQRAKQIEASLGTIQRAWIGVSGAAKSAWDAMLNVGRPASLQSQIAEIDKQLAAAQGVRERTAGGGLLGQGVAAVLGASESDIAALRQKRDLLSETIRLESRSLTGQQERATLNAAELTWAQRMESLRTKEAKDRAEIAKIEREGLAAGKSRVEIEKAIAAYRAQGAKSGGRAAGDDLADAKSQGQAYAQIISSLVSIQAKYTDQIEQSSAAQQVLNKAISSGAFASLPKNLQDAITAFARETDAVQQNAEAKLLLARIQRDVEVSNAKAADDRAKYIDTLQAEIARERERVEQIGMTREAIDARTLAQMDATIATKEATLADLQLVETQSPLIAAYEEEIRLLKERRALFATGAERQAEIARREASQQAARESASAWQKAADDINRGLTDSLFRAAEAGKGFFETLRDSVVGMFNNLVLRPIVSATVGAVTSGLGLTGAANAATGGGGLSSLSTLAGLGGSLGAFGSGFSSGLTAWGAGGSVTGLLSSGSSLFAGGIANGLGTIAGALGPIALGVAAIAAIVSALDDGGGPKTGGSFSTTGERLFTPADADALATSIGQSVVASTTALLSRYGGSLAGSTVSIGFDRDPLGESGTRIASRVISAGGRTTLDNSVGRTVDDADLQAELQVEAQRVLLAALQAANLQNGFAEVFSRLDPATAAPEAIANLLSLADTLYALGEASKLLPGIMGEVANLSATAREQLIGFAGGLDALVSAQAAYYSEFYSEAERYAQAQINLTSAFADLGLAFTQVDTREEFRAVVEGIDLQTEAGRSLYASVLKLAAPLAQWIDQTDALAVAAQTAADAVREAEAAAERDRLARQQAAVDAAIAAAAQMLQEQIDDVSESAADMVTTFGDLEGAMAEINATAGTLVDRWRETRSAIEQIQQALGTFVDMSTSGQIAAVVDARAANLAQRDSIVAFRDSLTDSIFEAMLSGLSPSDQAAQLRVAEREAFGSIATSDDPVSAARRATDLSLRRIALEARIEEDGRRENLDLAEQARELQADTLRDQIDGLRTLAEYANQLRETSFALKTGSLSALNPETQLNLARNEFDRLAERARAGDSDALGSIGGVAQTLLEEARGIYGSGRPYASIFSGVTGTLDELGASASGAAQQAEALSRQLAAVEATQVAAEFTADTSAETVTVLTAIDAALTVRQDALDTSIAAQTAALTGLLTTLTTVESNQRAQITQAAATWTQLQARMDALVAQQAAQARSTQAQEAIV